MEEDIPVGIVHRDDAPLLKCFEDIIRFVGSDSDSEKKTAEAKEWFSVRRKMISESLMKAVARSPKGRRKFRIPVTEMTIGSGDLAPDVLELIAFDLASTGYECDVKSGHLYFWPMHR